MLVSEYVVMKWTNYNRSRYMKLGYPDIKKDSEFKVKLDDLSDQSGAIVDVVCDYCNQPYQVHWCHYNNGRRSYPKDACSVCRGLKNSESSFEKRKNKLFDKIDEMCRVEGYELLTPRDDYIDIHMKIFFNCPIHGEFSVIANDLFSYHQCRCQKCAREKGNDKMRYSPEFITKFVYDNTGNKLLNADEYVNAHENNLIIRCKCGKTYIASYHGIQQGVAYLMCQDCSKAISMGERKIKDTLDTLEKHYIQEYKFNDCRDVLPLPFDFYLPNYNMVIEYDGIQHYYPTFGDETFNMTQRHDKIKTEYCKNNNIFLLRIPYTEYTHIEDILNNTFNEIGKRNSLIS